MKKLALIYEHNSDGHLRDIHDSSWVPGMFRKEGKLFVLKDDPRRIKIPEDPKPVTQTPSYQNNTNSGYVWGKAKKRSSKIKTYKCRKRYDVEVILKHISQRKMTISTKQGEKKYCITDPLITKSLRGFCHFNKKNSFAQFIIIPSKYRIYVWKKGSGATNNTSPEEADFLIQY